jgi:NitT/TauT family transport system ATP-binding protein
MTAAFELRDAVKSHLSREGLAMPALAGATLSGAEGAITCLLGPTASGKSTSLRLLAGLDRPDQGEALVDGRPPLTQGGRIGYLTQRHTLMPWMTVEGNVSLPMALRGVPAGERRERAASICDSMGLGEALGLYPYELSGGMQQRAALGRLLATESTHWLMDEPFASLDERTQHALERLLLQLRDDHGLSVLLVTHSIDEAVFLADRVVMLSAGPGRTADSFEIGMEHPRDRLSPEYGALMERIRRGMESVLGQ